MKLETDDIALLLLAQNARFRIASRLTTKNQTGYQIRPECDIFGRKTIPASVSVFLTKHGLPAQQRYTKAEHLSRLMRLITPFKDFTKEPEGFLAVLHHVGSLPNASTHDEVLHILEVLENEPI
tara:strand:+ start:402 stop:773 length:372 start_codon:yes stop_codon:yes gene_type:complete